MNIKSFISYFAARAIGLPALLFTVFSASALDASHYAANSALAEGKWARIKVNGTGMHLITAADIKALGFSDISKVNVYGTGGRMVREALTADMPDDLPMLPCERTSRGILFYAVDNVTWDYSGRTLTHSLNPYCSESYYFISDRAPAAAEPAPSNAPRKIASKADDNAEAATRCLSRALHERDLESPGEAGRIMLGEDFRTTRSQKFTIPLPGLESGDVTYTVGFGARVSNGSSTLKFDAGDGSNVSNATIPGVSESQFIVRNEFARQAHVEGGKLNLTIDYSCTGALFTARLDYIRVEYERTLDLKEGEIVFYDKFPGATRVKITGASENSRVWNVTDPARPVAMECGLDGDALYFTAPSGYGEYVAFDTAKGGASVTRAGIVANQNIHGMEEPDMVIIAYSEYASAAAKIARLHEEEGLTVSVLTPEAVYNEFSGGHPDVGAFRKLLKMWHDRPGERSIRYCLLMGRGSFDTRAVSQGVKSAGYRPLPLWQSPDGVTEESAFSTDDIIGMLDDVTENEFSMSSAKMHVAVGRLPVKNATEAGQMADKIDRYVRKPDYGSWRNRAMLIADDNDNAIHLTQSETAYGQLSSTSPHFRYEKLYLDSYPLEYTSIGASYPKAKERMKRLWNDGVLFTNYIGHASTTSWTHEKLMTWDDIISMSNRRLTFLYAATCLFARWDALNVSGGEIVVLNPDAGMIGMIAPSRTVYMGQNGTLNKYMMSHMLTRAADGMGIRVGDVFVEGKNRYNDNNKLRYCLVSDPALRMPVAPMDIEFTDINGTDPATTAELPEIPALGTINVSGTVNAADGSVASDFNGTVVIDLYDAEKAMESLGNGDKGKKEIYNDRKTRLSTVSAKVANGRWNVTVRVPAEIENNHSPARIIAYAWSDGGGEAHGSTEKLYVSGYADTETTDTEGPVIERFYLNYPEFEEGATVNANPVAHARFHDVSGINLSDAGIGHRMSLTLDSDRVYSDVSDYYTPDPDVEGGGIVAYPLSGLPSGEHTLTLAVYDNANNVSKSSVTFNVGTAMDPVIRSLGTDVNPASTSVVFNVTVDRPNTDIQCLLEVFDLMGRRVWSVSQKIVSDMQGYMEAGWNLCDGAGRRVPRGIYLYRATVETPEGMYTSQTRKLAVTAR